MGTQAVRVLLLLMLALLAGCASTPAGKPGNPENICEIFRERPSWRDAARKTRDKWGVPPPIPLAMMYQESSFRADAQPPRYFFLGLVPWGRVSSAYGYAQAKDETWADYKREAGGWFASRDNFTDSMDFMGWYISKTQRLAGVSKTDAYNQYLSYHEGWTGYRNRSYEAKAWLIRVAHQVQARADRFAGQYRNCPD